MTDAPQFEKTEDGLLVRAPAKLNLSLLVAGKRPDGFHELETVMAKIDWYDEILIQPGDKKGIELICNGREWAPAGEDNLVCQAARRVLAESGQVADLRLTLTKNVPAGTGLGAASSDAATTLLGLDRYLNLGLSHAVLAEIAAALGSDVAFFLGGPLAFCRGKGEKIVGLTPDFGFTALLFLPAVSVSTKTIYNNYIHDPVGYEQYSRRLHAYLEKNRIDFIAEMCANMLETTCFHLFEQLGELKRTIESLGVRPVCLSGSGSAMFCILDDHDIERLIPARDELTEKTGCRSVVVRNNRW